MRNSDKCIVKFFVFIVIGIASIWYLSTDSGIQLINKHPIITLSILSLIFLFAGSNRGAARGWHDIELRRLNPEFFADEKLEDD